MSGLFIYAGSVFMGFFAIMNPIAKPPVFLDLTGDFKNHFFNRLVAIHLVRGLIS